MTRCSLTFSSCRTLKTERKTWSSGGCALISCSHANSSSRLLPVMTGGVVCPSQRTQIAYTTSRRHTHWRRARLVSSVIFTTICRHKSLLCVWVKLKQPHIPQEISSARGPRPQRSSPDQTHWEWEGPMMCCVHYYNYSTTFEGVNWNRWCVE